MTTWFITGANKGLGLAITRSVLQAGHNVVATDRTPDQVGTILSNYGDRLMVTKLDITKPEEAEYAAAEAVKKFGSVDVLVNNAGYGLLGFFENFTQDQIRQQYEVNIFGPMNVTRAILPIMRRQRSGHIFSTSSVAGIVSGPGATLYSGSKFAVEGWMEGLRDEVSPFNIKTTLVEPGYFNTDFLDRSSVAYAKGNIEDYGEATKKFTEWHDNMNHNQLGDPEFLGPALLKLSLMAEPPLRFAAGSDAFGLVIAKADALRANAEQFEALTKSTDRVALSA